MSGVDFPEYLDVDIASRRHSREAVEPGWMDRKTSSTSTISSVSSVLSSTIKHTLEYWARSRGKSLGGDSISHPPPHDEGGTFPAPTIIHPEQSKGNDYLASFASVDAFSLSTVTLERQSEAKYSKSGWRSYLGLGLTLISGILYALAALLVKLLKDDYHPFMISIWRFQGIFTPSVLLFLVRYWLMGQNDFQPVWPLRERRKAVGFTVLMLRGILGCWCVVLQFYSLQYLEVADSMVITSSTSVFVTLFAHVALGEKCALIPILTSVLSMAGIFIISRPPMFTGKEKFDAEILIGIGMAMGCMISSAAILVMQRYLKDSHFSIIQLSSGFWGTLQCILVTYFVGVFKLPETLLDTFYGTALAVITFFAQSCLVIALKFEEAGPVAIVQSCDVIFAFLWQFALLGVVPDLFSLVGSIVIITGLLITAMRKCLIVLPEDHKSRKRFKVLLM